MINEKIQKAFNEQINLELFSAYLYLDMARYCEEETFEGFAHWLREQAKEEVAHAMRFYDHIIRREGKVELKAIDQPNMKYKSLEDVFEKSLEHERMISASINKLMDLANEQKDHPSLPILNWFIEEQMEEEENFGGILDRLKKVEGGNAGLLFLDAKMAARPTASVEPRTKE